MHSTKVLGWGRGISFRKIGQKRRKAYESSVYWSYRLKLEKEIKKRNDKNYAFSIFLSLY